MPSEKRQIFIVDDDISVCRALSVLLSTYGFTVDSFTSGKAFFKAVPNSAPGVLILDIHMPEMDGWEVMDRINRSGSKRPVIVVSADKDSGTRQRALKASAVGYLKKPFNERDIIALINSAFQKNM